MHKTIGDSNSSKQSPPELYVALYLFPVAYDPAIAGLRAGSHRLRGLHLPPSAVGAIDRDVERFHQKLAADPPRLDGFRCSRALALSPLGGDDVVQRNDVEHG